MEKTLNQVMRKTMFLTLSVVTLTFISNNALASTQTSTPIKSSTTKKTSSPVTSAKKSSQSVVTVSTPIKNLMDQSTFDQNGLPEISEIVSVSNSKLFLELDNGVIKDIFIPEGLQELTNEEMAGILDAIRNGLIAAGGPSVIKNKTNWEQFTYTLQENIIDKGLLDISDLPDINALSIEIAELLVFEDIGNLYVDMLVASNTAVENFMQGMKEMMIGAVPSPEWLRNGENYTVYYEGHSYQYIKGENGVVTVVERDENGTIISVTDNDSNDDDQPDTTWDAFWEWLTGDGITAESEAGRTRLTNTRYTQFISYMIADFYQNANIKNLQSSFASGGVSQSKYLNTMNQAFTQYLSSANLTTLKNSFEKSTGLTAPVINLQTMRFK